MNKEELEQAFNETTDNAVKVINDYKELIVKYNIMKENAETLAKRIDKAIELIKNDDIIVKHQEFENKYTVNFYDRKKKLLNILEGKDE